MNANQNAELARHTVNLLQLKAGKIKTNKLIFEVSDYEVANEIEDMLTQEKQDAKYPLDWYSERGLDKRVFTVSKINKK